MGAPDDFHDDVHPDATEITGDRRYGEWGQCVAHAKSADRRCRGYAQGPHGKCSTHGGATPTKDENPDVGNGDQDDNQNAVTHSLRVKQVNATYQKVFDEDVQTLVDDIHDDYLADYERIHGETPSKGIHAELFRIAVSYGQHVHADRWAVEKPDELQSGSAAVDRETHYTDEGTKYHRYRETVVAKGQARLSRDRRAWLKDLGLLNDPQSQQADATAGLISILSEEANSDGSE